MIRAERGRVIWEMDAADARVLADFIRHRAATGVRSEADAAQDAEDAEALDAVADEALRYCARCRRETEL